MQRCQLERIIAADISDPLGLTERQLTACGRRSWFVQEMRERAETPAPPGFGKESIQRVQFSCAWHRWHPRPIPNLDWAILFLGAAKEGMALTDKFGRQITDLRVSVTDRCNFRCVYCRSADPENHMAEHALLEWDEYERLVRILVGMGIRKVRVTGGEPLVRPGVEDFVARLKAIGVQDLSMTTNGHLLAERCDRLVAAGLDRINISLDSLDREKFEKVTRTKTFDQVMAGIEAAQDSPLRPVKVNAVLVRGLNDDEVEAFAEFAREKDIIMRFIEFMPLDADRAWTRDMVVPAAEVHRAHFGALAADSGGARTQRDRAQIPLRGRRRRNRIDRAGDAALLRALLAHPADRRWKIAHVPLQQGRSRSEKFCCAAA